MVDFFRYYYWVYFTTPIKMLIEKVILVDFNNQELGGEEKLVVHQKWLLHRAFSIFIFNSKHELLLQQRAVTKYHSDSLWSNTVCGHPRPGESTQEAASRRLHEEMEIECDLKEMGSFMYKAELENGLSEHEYDTVFIGIYDDEYRANPAEIMNTHWISSEELQTDMASHPEKYSVWLGLALELIT